MYKELSKANAKLQKQRIASKVWTKGDILAFGKMLNSMKYSDKERKDKIWDLYNDLESAIGDFGYEITEEQSNFGIEWLNALCFTKSGKYSRAQKVQDFNGPDFDIVRNFLKFEFMGFYENVNGYYSHYVPIYRTIDKDGNYFDYTVAHWGTPEIVGRGKTDLMQKSPLMLALDEIGA